MKKEGTRGASCHCNHEKTLSRRERPNESNAAENCCVR